MDLAIDRTYLYDRIKTIYHGEPQALATEIWGKICPPSDQEAIV